MFEKWFKEDYVRFKSIFAGKKVLVTGASGLIGRQVVNVLNFLGAKVYGVSLDQVEIDNASLIYGDLRDFEFCKFITTDIDFVFHLAGIKGSAEVTLTKPASFFVPMLMFNTNVLEASRVNQVSHTVYCSSIGAYESSDVFIEDDNITKGPPMDHYPGWAKRMAELQIETYKIQYSLNNFTTVRPCSVFGPWDNFDPDTAMVIPSLLAKIHRGDNPVVIWGDGSAIRDFAYSKDISVGIVKSILYTDKGYLNLASGQGMSIRELVQNISKILNFNYVFDDSKPSGYPKRVMSIEKAKKAIGYQYLTPFSEAITETWEYLKSRPTDHLKKYNAFKG